MGDSASLAQIELQKQSLIDGSGTRERLQRQSKNFFYPNSKVYKNKYRIINQQKLNEVYSRNAKEMMARLRLASPPEQFSASYLKSLHKQIFSNIFEWAGHTRDEIFMFSDGSAASAPFLRKKDFKKAFAAGREIQQGLQQLDAMLLGKDALQNLTREEFVEHVSEVMAHLYSLNPFKEGNRYAIRLFAEKIGQAANCELDFSLISKRRKALARSEVVDYGNKGPLKHILDDLSDPEKVIVLREFINNMRALGLEDKNYRPTYVAQEGHTYHGIYRGSGAEGFVIDVHGTHVVASKKHLAPEQVKTLKIGDTISFTTPSAQEMQKVLIPAENIPDLSYAELSQRVYDSASVKNSMRNITVLSKLVYGKKGALKDVLPKFKIPITSDDLEAGEKLARAIGERPQNYGHIRGVSVLGLKSSARQHAEANFSALGYAILGYTYALKQAEREILETHLLEQKRCAKAVEPPNKRLSILFVIDENHKQEVLSKSPGLRVYVQDYFKKLSERLPQSAQKAIESRHYSKLADIIGTSTSHAVEIGVVFKGTKELHDIIQQQHREMSKQQKRDVRQSPTKSGGVKSVKMKEKNAVECNKQDQKIKGHVRQRRTRSMMM